MSQTLFCWWRLFMIISGFMARLLIVVLVSTFIFTEYIDNAGHDWLEHSAWNVEGMSLSLHWGSHCIGTSFMHHWSSDVRSCVNFCTIIINIFITVVVVVVLCTRGRNISSGMKNMSYVLTRVNLIWNCLIWSHQITVQVTVYFASSFLISTTDHRITYSHKMIQNFIIIHWSLSSWDYKEEDEQYCLKKYIQW